MAKKIVKKDKTAKEKKAPNILARDSFWVVNKSLARHFKSNDAVVLLSELIYKHDYWKAKNQLDEEDGFFVKGSDLEKDVNINKRERLKLTKVLVKARLLVVKKKGTPARNWYSVKFEEITDLLKVLKIDDETKRLVGSSDLSWSEIAPINNKVVRKGIDIEESSIASLRPKEEKPKRIKEDSNLEVSSLVQDTFLKVDMITEVTKRYLEQHPEHTDIIEALVFIIKHDKSTSLDERFPDNYQLCLNQLDNLVKGRGLSQKEVDNIQRIYLKNLDHQERLKSGFYRKQTLIKTPSK